jgi:hypothetical protein
MPRRVTLWRYGVVNVYAFRLMFWRYGVMNGYGLSLMAGIVVFALYPVACPAFLGRGEFRSP